MVSPSFRINLASYEAYCKKNVPTDFNGYESNTLNQSTNQYPNSICLLDNGNLLATDPLATLPDRLQISRELPLTFITMASKLIPEQNWDPADPDYFTGSYSSQGIPFNYTSLRVSSGYYMSYIAFAYDLIWLKDEYVTNDKNYVITNVNSNQDQLKSIFGNEISNIESSLLDNDHYFIYQENLISVSSTSADLSVESLYQGFTFEVLILRLKDNYVPVAGDTIKFHFKSEFLELDSDFSYTFQNE